MSREWTDKDESVLNDAEKFFKTATLVMGTVDLWTDNVGEEIPPDELEASLRSRVQHVMWKVSMLKMVLAEDNPGAAVGNLLRWLQGIGAPGMIIQEFDTKEEADAAARAVSDAASKTKPGDDRPGYL